MVCRQKASTPHFENLFADYDYIDVIVIGGGFAGCTSLHRIRDAGFSVHLYEAGAALGGVWHWNRYPGCRVDTETPFYQMTDSRIFREWSWSSRFPDERELKAYFQHADKVLGLSKDISYNSVVTGADFNVETARWTITTDKGDRATCKWLVPAAGNTHIRYTPAISGMDSFKGRLIHTADWPTEPVDFSGKRVAIVGTGATGVQCVQEIAKAPGLQNLTVYVRNPNIALPMVQRQWSALDNIIQRGTLKGVFGIARNHPANMATDTNPVKWADVSPEERRRYYGELFERGGFGFQAAAYSDLLTNEEANREAYDFWRERVQARVRDPKKQDILAPEEPPFPIGTKRSSLEQDYYECLDRDSTEVVSVKKTPFKCFTERGIVTEDGTEREHDIVLMATGFDNMTGSLTRMGLRGKDGVDMKDRWKDGVFTSHGILASGNPNMFMVFGPQGKCSNWPLLQYRFLAILEG